MLDAITRAGVNTYHWAEQGIHSLHLPERGASLAKTAAKTGAVFFAWAQTSNGIGTLSLTFGTLYILYGEENLRFSGTNRTLAKLATIGLLLIAGAHLFG